MVVAQEPSCRDVNKRFKTPKGPDAISCCNTPENGYERPLEHDSAKFLDPDDLIESLRKHQKTDDVEIFAERALNVYRAYYGRLNPGISYNVLFGSFRNEGYPGKYFYTDEYHDITVTPAVDPTECHYLHPKSDRYYGGYPTIRLFVNGSYTMVNLDQPMKRRNFTTGQFIKPSLTFTGSHSKCLDHGWSKLAPKLLDFFNPEVQKLYNSSVDLRSLPGATIVEWTLGPTNPDVLTGYDGKVEPGLSIVRLFMYWDHTIQINSVIYTFIENTPRNDFRGLDYPVFLIDDDIIGDITSPYISGSRHANSWSEALQLANTIRAKEGFPLIAI